MWWLMIAHVYGLLSIPAAELGDIRNGGVVQSPKGVLIERLDPIFQTNLNAVRQ
jgi:hypothetical protein